MIHSVSSLRFCSQFTNLIPPLGDESNHDELSAFSRRLQLPGEDVYKNKVEEEKLTSKRFPDWYVLTTLSQSFQSISVNGVVPIATIRLLRDELYQSQHYREARVADQLIKYKGLLMGVSAPWRKPRFKSLPGYSWADIQFLREKVKAGQDVSDIVASDYKRKSQEAAYRANWAEIFNTPLTLMVALSSLSGIAIFQKRFPALKPAIKPMS